MKMQFKYYASLSALLLCACGKVGQLEPKLGAKSIPVAFGNEKPANYEELSKASAQQRPGRSVELLRRSERRVADPFDLPPGGDPDAASADATGDAATPSPKAD